MTVWVHIVDGTPTEVRMGKGVEDELFNNRVEELLKDKDWGCRCCKRAFLLL